MSAQVAGVHSAEIEYSFDLIRKASARFSRQQALVDAMASNADDAIVQKEQYLLVALECKLRSLTALHDELLTHVSTH